MEIPNDNKRSPERRTGIEEPVADDRWQTDKQKPNDNHNHHHSKANLWPTVTKTRSVLTQARVTRMALCKVK
jgi:hypothetical protein